MELRSLMHKLGLHAQVQLLLFFLDKILMKIIDISHMRGYYVSWKFSIKGMEKSKQLFVRLLKQSKPVQTKQCAVNCFIVDVFYAIKK